MKPFSKQSELTAHSRLFHGKEQLECMGETMAGIGIPMVSLPGGAILDDFPPVGSVPTSRSLQSAFNAAAPAAVRDASDDERPAAGLPEGVGLTECSAVRSPDPQTLL